MTVDVGDVGPLLTRSVAAALRDAREARAGRLECSLDLGRTKTWVTVGDDSWASGNRSFPFIDNCRDRTVYYWTGTGFEPVARFTNALTKLVPTDWGPPTFEIDGIKMLPTARVSPYEDARRKVALVNPRGKIVLDTCAGLGYFAAWCLAAGAKTVHSFEKNADVLWLRRLNPWSPDSAWADHVPAALAVTLGDVSQGIVGLADESVDAVLHDPPRFGTAGELYARAFYEQLARVLRPRGRLFHYVGTPNRLTTGRNVPREVAERLRQAGFSTEFEGDGVVGVRQRRVQARPLQ